MQSDMVCEKQNTVSPIASPQTWATNGRRAGRDGCSCDEGVTPAHRPYRG